MADLERPPLNANPHYRYVGWYLRHCREAFRMAKAGIPFLLGDWPPRPIVGLTVWRREFMDALDRRINFKGRLDQSGRKWQPDYQAAIDRDCRRVRDRICNRVRFYQLETPEMHRRFSHLSSSCDN